MGPSRIQAWDVLSPKSISLSLLTFQNSALILMMHYSRIMPLVGEQRYFPSTAVLISELFKLAISLTAATWDLAKKHPNLPVTSLVLRLPGIVFSTDSWKMAIPASLYTLQNTLQYIGCSNLDASTFQITYQLKILTTAEFSVLLLGRRLSPRKWLSLLSLTAGVALVQLPGGSESNVDTTKHSSRGLGDEIANLVDKTLPSQTPHMNATLGLVAVLVACFSSGIAGVYFERVLKEQDGKSSPQISLWVRNVQLSFYSLFPALLIGVIYRDGEQIAHHGFFAGYNSVVWSTITLQAVGGVIVANVINYADNIAKNFATSISIIISFIASVILFNLSVSFHYLLGIATVIGSTGLYNIPDPPRRHTSVIEDSEKQELARDRLSYDLFSDGPPSDTLQLPFNDGFSTSRPGTPMNESSHARIWSSRKQKDKREA